MLLAALFEGITQILSPCIFMVLPLVLCSSLTGGSKKPAGVILGFVLSFTVFVLASRYLVRELHFAPYHVKQASLTALMLLGLVLIAEWPQQKNTHAKGDGLMTGLFAGILIGLLWIPCAGPVLTEALIKVVQQELDAQTAMVILSFAIGAGLSLFASAIILRKAMKKFLASYAQGMRKTCGTITIFTVVFIASSMGTQMAFAQKVAPNGQSGLQEALAVPYTAPEFSGISTWLNSEPLSMKQLEGKVVLVDFWAYSCVNCVRTLPHLREWHAKYHDKGLIIVGVHAPEFDFEKDPANVKHAVTKWKVPYPVAMDNDLATWNNYSNQYWPAHYLVNKQGNVVYTHFGEGKYDVMEHNIRTLLGLNAETTTVPQQTAYAQDQTPETYLGYFRAEHFASTQPVTSESMADYSYPTALPLHHWALQGQWKVGSQRITAGAKGASLKLHFKSQKVFLVLGSATGKPIQASITLNNATTNTGKDAPDGKLTVDQHILYELIAQPEHKEGELEITTEGEGLEAYAFTFGQ